MPLEQFIATSAADVAQQIRSRLGADAVVVNIANYRVAGSKNPASKCWPAGPIRQQNQRHQRLRGSPDSSGATDRRSPVRTGRPAVGKRARSRDLRTIGFSPKAVANAMVAQRYGKTDAALSPRCARAKEKAENSGRALLESVGLLPLVAERVLEHMPVTQPPWLAGELKQVRAALRRVGSHARPPSDRSASFRRRSRSRQDHRVVQMVDSVRASASPEGARVRLDARLQHCGIIERAWRHPGCPRRAILDR